MGDSYSAGNGGGGQSGFPWGLPDGCWRSNLNYAGRYASILQTSLGQPATIDNVACSGATTNNFSGWQRPHKILDGWLPQPPQLNALKNKHYDVIFLTIGGNDLHFGDIIQYCMIDIFRKAQTCESNLKRAERMLVKPAAGGDSPFQTKLRNLLKKIALKANPEAKIVLLGYPQLEGSDSYQLSYGSAIVPSRKPPRAPVLVGLRVRQGGVDVQTQQQAMIDEFETKNPGHYVFAPVIDKFVGHELFAGALEVNAARWLVKPFVDANVSDNFYHPNPDGWRAEAEMLACSHTIPNKKVALTVTDARNPDPALCSGGPAGPLTVTCADGSAHVIPFVCPVISPAWPTKDNEGSIGLRVLLGAYGRVWSWISCSSSYCIVGVGDIVYLYRMSDLTDRPFSLATPDPGAAFLAAGVPFDQIVAFMKSGPP